MINQFLKDKSLRTKLTLLPIVASAFLLAMVVVFIHLTIEENTLLKRIEEQTLAKIDKLMSLKDKLSQNHGELFALLASSSERWDEEQIYVQGKPKLYAIHDIEDALEAMPRNFAVNDNEQRRTELLLKRLGEYKREAISAIEMASVDLNLANRFMVLANGKYVIAAKNFAELVNTSKNETISIIRQSRETFMSKAVGAGAIALVGMAVLMFISIRISNIVTQQIKDQIGLMKRLSDGDTEVAVPIPDRSDEISELARGVAAFRTSLIETEIATKNLIEKEIAKDRAEKANVAKSMFLANMSHELRTPIHGILSFANFGIKNAAKADTQKLTKYFETIRDSGTTLLRLVNDVLDLAKLEAGKMTLDKILVDPKMLVAKVIDEFESMTRDKKIAIKLASFESHRKIQADPTRLMQVVRNLLSNALKFSPEQASVTIGAREENRSLIVSVADEGPGIPADEIEAIFDKFVQSSNTRTGAGGTGLGLPICREIMAAHDGTIWAENNPGRGAVFFFSLPLTAAQVGEEPEQAPREVQGELAVLLDGHNLQADTLES